MKTLINIRNQNLHSIDLNLIESEVLVKVTDLKILYPVYKKLQDINNNNNKINIFNCNSKKNKIYKNQIKKIKVFLV